MTALTLRKLSPLARRELISHRRALSSPMTRIPMAGDPILIGLGTVAGGRAMLERRACQYAAWIVSTERPSLDLAQFKATYDGFGRVSFVDRGRNGGGFGVDIPTHILDFDPMTPALALSAPEAEHAPRCDHTAPLELSAPESVIDLSAIAADLDAFIATL